MSSSLAFAQPKISGNIKLVLVGTPGVGNTSFLVTTSSGRFPEEYVPQVNAEGTLAVTHKDSGKTVAITLWDTAGQEDYSRIRPLSYGNTDVFMIGYSVTDDDSLWRAEEMYYPEVSHHCPDVPVILVGLKTDLKDDRVFSYDDGLQAAIRIGAYHFFECSSKESDGTDPIFQAAIAACLPPPATKWSWIPSFRKKKKPSRIQEAIDASAVKRAEAIAVFASKHAFAAQSVAGDTYALDEWVGTADLHAALVQAHPSLGDGAEFMLCEAETNREVQRGTFTPEQAMAMPSPGKFMLLFNAV